MKTNSIRNAVLAISVACAGVACTDGTPVAGIPTAAGESVQASLDGQDTPTVLASAAADHPLPQGGPAPAAAGFASLPDHGDLVEYPADKAVRRAGPYTWHRADISEAHARNAIVDGVLTLTAPSGQQLRFEYDRHVEHASGDWTWIGHLAGGSAAMDAILTFGAGAVFGTIAQPGSTPLKLAMQDGASWLVETDVAARAAQSKASGRYETPDFLVPPDLPVVQGLRAQAAGVRSAGAATAGTTIDVLVGYTTGFAQAKVAQTGNQNAVATRLNYLVEVTNESYVNSQVAAKVRLVHSMQVSYADATDNGDALRDLTGSDGTTTPTLTGVDAALRPLHSARDQYGADLVVLVRDFLHPEAVSCGVAWLLGGGKSTLHAGYEIYGMGVVSDGADGGYYCEDTTFAHELGHNMGLAHDVETAKGDDGVLDDPDDYGRYPYSFGYKTGLANGNFYTVMAYGDDGQNGIHVFSNPDITFCSGYPCGIAGQADNARTLRDTQAIVASFRATVVPEQPETAPSNDFNGDGKSDLLWRHAVNGQDMLWFSGNFSTRQALATVTDRNWKVVGTGDFNGDGEPDILWRNASSGRNAIWRSGNAATQQTIVGVTDLDWQVAAVGDFDGDGQDDIFWRNAGTGRNTIWRSANFSTRISTVGVTDLAWEVVGAGDFNGDGNADVLWRNGRTGRNAIWRSGNAGTQQSISAVTDVAWEAVGIGDFNGDGTDDIFWRNAGNGQDIIWRSANSGLRTATSSVSVLSWQVVAVGDYDGDGNDDVVWRNAGNGRNAIWLSGNATTQQSAAQVTDLSWEIVG